MKTFKKILLEFPEYYLVVLVLATGYTPPYSINQLAIFLAIILVIQIVFNNKIVGILLALVLIAIDLYLLLALFSEFRDFPVVNKQALQLLSVELTLIVFNLFVAGVMLYNYSYGIILRKHPNSLSP